MKKIKALCSEVLCKILGIPAMKEKYYKRYLLQVMLSYLAYWQQKVV